MKDSEHTVPPGLPRPLDRLLREQNPGTSWGDVRRAVRTGKVRVDGSVVTDPSAPVRAGAVVAVRMSAPRPEKIALPRDAIVFADAQVVVVNKPAGIATVPYEDERDTLDRLVQAALRKTARAGTSVAPLGVVQRLDRETSGLIVFARTTAAKRHLQQQFRTHAIHRRYLAIAWGRVADRTLRSRLVKDRGDGRRGSTDHPDLGREAVTHVRVLESLRDATFVECRLETGRTHQIRIHLAEAGHPLLGERVYGDRRHGAPALAPRVMLHAAELGFVHPTTGEELHFEERLPPDMEGVLDGLRDRTRRPRAPREP
jgi:23S rRNA pseudouridine1911/1915/1917 synthase